MNFVLKNCFPTPSYKASICFPLLVFKFAIGIFQFIWNWFWCVVWGKDLISFVFCRGSQLFKHLLLTIYLPTPDLQSVIWSHSTCQYVSDFRFGSGWSISELIAHSQVLNAFWCLRGTSFFSAKVSRYLETSVLPYAFRKHLAKFNKKDFLDVYQIYFKMLLLFYNLYNFFAGSL